MSPFSRGNQGLAYSRSYSAGSDWPNSPNYPSLNSYALRWGASPVTNTDKQDEGLGMGISYALHPDFCNLMLPGFPEDGYQTGQMDGFISRLECANLQSAIHTAFGTWAVNNPHISFVDRTTECAAPGMIGADGFCSRAEVIIGAEDLTLTPYPFVAYFQPDTGTLNHGGSDPLYLTSGTQIPSGLGLRRGKIIMTTAECWYLDATFCTALHSMFQSSDMAVRLTLVVVTMLCGFVVLYVVLRCFLAAFGFHTKEKRMVRRAMIAARASIRQRREVTRERRATRKAESGSSPSSPYGSAIDSPSHSGMSPPPSPPAPERAAARAAPPPRLQVQTSRKSVEEEQEDIATKMQALFRGKQARRRSDVVKAADTGEMRLNIRAGVGLEIQLSSQARSTMRRSDISQASPGGEELFSQALEVHITGPSNAVKMLKKELKTRPEGLISPPRSLTLSGAAKKAAGIPENAAAFSFGYPLALPPSVVDPSSGALNHLLALAAKEPWLGYIMLGGFVYLDKQGKVVQVNAITLQPNEHGLELAGPLPASEKAVEALKRKQRMQPVTQPELRQRNYRNFGWVNAGERPGGEAVTTAAPYTAGAFVYEIEGRKPIVFILVQGDFPLKQAVLKAIKRHALESSVETATAMYDEMAAMRSHNKNLQEGWMASVLRDFDIEKKEVGAFDAQETLIKLPWLGESKRWTNLVMYLAEAPFGMLLIAIFWLFAAPIFYERVFLPCWDCHDFQAMVAHEVGHLLGFDHPDIKPLMNLQLQPNGVPYNTTCVDPLAHAVLTGTAAVENNAASIMHSTTLRRSITCLTADDLAGLDALYPDCYGDGTPRTPECHVEKKVGGWLRFGFAVGVPFCLTAIILMFPISIVRRYQKRRVSALEAQMRQMHTKAAWGRAGAAVRSNVRDRIREMKAQNDKLKNVVALKKGYENRPNQSPTNTNRNSSIATSPRLQPRTASSAFATAAAKLKQQQEQSSSAMRDFTFTEPGTLGMTLMDRNGMAPVGISALKPGGQAERIGVPKGAVVAAINGVNMLRMDRVQMLEFVQKQGRPLIMSCSVKVDVDPMAAEKAAAEKAAKAAEKAKAVAAAEAKAKAYKLAVEEAAAFATPITFRDSGPLGMTLMDRNGEPPVGIVALKPGGQAEQLKVPIGAIVAAINGMDMLKTPRLKMLEVIAAERAKGPVTFSVTKPGSGGGGNGPAAALAQEAPNEVAIDVKAVPKMGRGGGGSSGSGGGSPALSATVYSVDVQAETPSSQPQPRAAPSLGSSLAEEGGEKEASRKESRRQRRQGTGRASQGSPEGGEAFSEEKVNERLERARAAVAAPMFGHDESVGVKIGLQEGEQVVRT